MIIFIIVSLILIISIILWFIDWVLREETNLDKSSRFIINLIVLCSLTASFNMGYALAKVRGYNSNKYEIVQKIITETVDTVNVSSDTLFYIENKTKK